MSRIRSSPRLRRTEVGGARSGAMCGSSRAAYSMTSPGTRNPRVSSSTCASGLPRCPSASAQDRVAHGVVACARSPSTVSDPVALRRPIARSIIGDRSCASSTTMWPRDGVRSTRSAASSSSTASARDQGVVPGEALGLSHSSSRCSSSVRMPSAAAASASASESRRCTSLAGSTAGHSVAAYSLTGLLRATAACTRSSGESPSSSIRTQDAVGEGLGQHRAGRAVPHPAGAQPRDDLLGLVGRDPEPARAPRQHQALGGGADVGPHGALEHGGQPPVALERRDVGAVGAADRPLRVERRAASWRRAPRWWTARPRSRPARAARPGCSAGSCRWGRPPARPGGGAGRGARRGGTPRGAARRPSSRSPVRPAPRCCGSRRRAR